jgi:very-short-patch-repair endonuclease
MKSNFLNSKLINKANYNLVQFSKIMSRKMTIPEQIIWFNLLSKRQFLGHKFIKQKLLGPYIADFYCSKLLLAVEIDGISHDEKQGYDKARDDFMTGIGITVLRFKNAEIEFGLAEVRKRLERFLDKAPV